MHLQPNLSDAALSLWGKSRRDDDGFLPLWRHLDDSSEVAGRLWDSWFPKAVRRQIVAAMPGGEADGRALVCWLAGIHDIGKATPAFTAQVPSLADRVHAAGLVWESDRVGADRRFAPHATAGQFLLDAWLTSEFGWSLRVARTFSIVVGGHHGVPPSVDALLELGDRSHLLGWSGSAEARWRETQRELLVWMTRRAGVVERLREWRDVRLPQPVQALITGAVIMSDWIASNERFFPYGADELGNRSRGSAAWDTLDLPAPWSPPVASAEIADLIQTRFSLPAGARPHPVQLAAIQVAREMSEPGLMVIEAPMGDGKTEAALAVAEVLAARFGLGGCFMALPTRATSDAMFDRFVPWVQRLPDQDPGRGPYDVGVAHGKARWNSLYQDLLWGRISGVGESADAQDVAAHSWMTGRKKLMLSSFVVGTIDQLLMMALQVKHVALRHFALAGKVVVIDEAHAYDVYMGRYLDRALAWLAAYGVPVIVLSATLPAKRRVELVRAYDAGRARPTPPRRSRRRPISVEESDPYDILNGDPGYPLIVASNDGKAPKVSHAKPSGRQVDVSVEYIDDDHAVLAGRLGEELGDGGTVLVIRNTVRRVLDTADFLRAQVPGIPVTIAHSRFMAPDRAAKDQWLRDTFGPEGPGIERPHRMIVVASQVAEQSLDVDFDLLVTDLAPVDLLLQRMGRLHRHPRKRPTRLGTARCWITGADWSASPPLPVRGSTAVYHQYPLLRAVAALENHQGTLVRLPEDIAPLVQAAYGDAELGPASWRDSIDEANVEFQRMLNEKSQKAGVFRLPRPGDPGEPLLGWFRAVIDDTEAKGGSQAVAQVRDTRDSLEVILLVERDGHLFTPSWLPLHGGRHVPTDTAPSSTVAKAAAGCSLALPAAIDVDTAISELEKRHSYPAWQKQNSQTSHWLSGELVLDIDDDGRGRVAGWEVRYDKEDGLRVWRTPA